MKKSIIISVLIILTLGFLTKDIKNESVKKNSTLSNQTIHNSNSSITEAYSQNWYASIQKDILEREYFISYDAGTGVYQSPNRQQNIRSYYAPGEWKLQNREDSLHHNWRATLNTIGIFADGKKIAIPQAQVEVMQSSNKLEYIHNGFTEQYINTNAGVRQNFIIDKAPKGTKELAVSLKLEGFTAKSISTTSAEWSNGNQTLTYSDLKVWDAEEKILNAHIQVKGNELALVVDAENAVYPITIDPIVTSGNPTNANTAIESNQASANMGYSVSGAGDVNGDGYSDVIVGAYKYDNGETDEGAAFLYHGSSNGLNTTVAATLECNQIAANLGSSVSNAGDVNGDGYGDLIIGASKYDNGQGDEGVAFIYHGSSSGIVTTAASMLESNVATAVLGVSVSGAGDVNGDGYSDVIAGASSYDNVESNEGAVYVFLGSASGINTSPSVILESNQNTAHMGQSVSGAGDVNGDGYSDIIVGAESYDNGQTDEGAAFLYHGSSTGITSSPASTFEPNTSYTYLGFSVSGAGDVNGDGYGDVIVGAYLYANGQSNEGAAFVYHGSASGANTTAAATLEGNLAAANLGFSVSGAGDVNGDGYSDVVVGAPGYNNGQSNEGIVRIYQGSATGLNTTAASIIESNVTSASLGNSVSGAGDVNGDGYSDIILGAYNYANGESLEGAFFVYHGSSSGLSTSYTTLVESNQLGAQMGFSVSSAGDVNGDGYSDVIVGAWLYDNGQTDEGAVFVYHGSATGLSTTAAATLECNQASAGMGYCVSSAGDINGDGYADILASANLYDNGQTDEGVAFVYHGSSSGVNTTAAVMLEANQASANFGNSVAPAGDINGDGFSDIVVGASQFDNGQTDEGSIFVYHGSSTGISTTIAATLESNQVSAKMGRSSGAGDVNSDGYDDIIASAQYYDDGETDEGAGFVYHGSSSGINTTYSTILEINQANAWFGRNIFPAGDVNADGYSDIIIGAQYYDNGETDEGGAFIYHGSASGINSTVATTLESNQASAMFGYSVCGAGDVNGDGYSDVIVGAYFYDNGQTNEGAVFIYQGSVTGVSSTAATFLENNQANSNLGLSVAGAGDINGDGYSDVIVGAHNYTNGQTSEGAFYVFQGNAGKGLRRNLRLFNTSSTSPIMQSNILSSQFAAGLYSKNPEGRTKGKLVWEVKNQGQVFTNSSTITKSTQYTAKQASYSNLGTAGTLLTNDITKPGFQTKVRARIQYDPATSQNGEVYSPWIYPQLYYGTQGMSATPLPITLVSFNATSIEDREVLLQWQTSSESNNDYFIIERSLDGINWEAINKIEGRENSSDDTYYTSLDRNPYSRDSYYRLKQVDIEGRYSYSEVVVATIDNYLNNQVFIYPNPTIGEVTIESSKEELESCKIYNSLGEDVSSIVIIREKNENKLKINVSQLITGIYTIRTLTKTNKIYKP